MVTELDKINGLKWAEQKGEKRGFAEGMAEGLSKGKAEVAKAMKETGLPSSTIAQCTGLSEKQIQAL